LSTSLISDAAAVAVLPPWEAIDTVLLDMDGTLLDLRFDNYFWAEFLPERYAERHGLTPEQARTVLRSMLVAKQSCPERKRSCGRCVRRMCASRW
jgi:5'-nucleotidase